MCDPFTMIAGALSAGGALMSGAGAMAGGSARAKSARMQAAIEASNAELAVQRGAFEAGRVRDEAGRASDSALGFYAASGVDPSFGGPAFAQAWSAAQGEQDAQIALARGGTESAQHLQSRAGLLAQGGDAKRAGQLSMASSVLQAGSAFAKTFAAPQLSPTAKGASATVETGDPWGASLRWGVTGGQPSFWHR